MPTTTSGSRGAPAGAVAALPQITSCACTTSPAARLRAQVSTSTLPRATAGAAWAAALGAPPRTMIWRMPSALAQSRPVRAAAPAPSKISPRVTTPSSSTASALRMTAVPARAGVAAARTAKAAMKRATVLIALRLQLAGRGQHAIGRGDDLGVHLVGALGDDQGGDFRHR